MTKKPLYKTAITGSRKVGLSLVGDFLKRHQRVAVIDLEAVPLELFAGPQFTDIDEWTGQIIVTSNKTHASLRREFGSDLVDMINGPINRDKLAERINGDAARMRKFNSIMHPAIRTRMAQKLELTKAAIAFVLVPFLFEHKMRDQFNEAWCVICDHPIQLQRIIAAEQVTVEQARALIDKHWPQKRKASLSNYVINNSGDPANTHAQILGLLPQALKRARAFARTPQAPPTSGSAA
jgi:dephospho-CoA kinase